ncbi:replication endonuclease [Vibrio parahaemolyticus]|uniref:replication endonuclease n=1 Tax=Vibrio parahaemolyticus TaxID=670 RepID=UPI00226ADAB5|nr:replication endonuclease [Vibrio parahaemolyticus]MCX8904528.1 replication endonuclease [Vibrio parahaemolyticus]
MKNIKFNSAEEKRNIRAHLDLMCSSFALIIEGTEDPHSEIAKIERSYSVLFNQYKAPITIEAKRINRECNAIFSDNLAEKQRIKRFNAFKSIKGNRQRRLYEIIKERNGRTMPCINQTLRARFRASAYFNASEQNTRDAGEELCAVVIHLMAKSAKVFNVHSVEFHLHFQKQLERALGKKLASIFPSALNKKGELKKTAMATLKRLNDKKTCRNNFNRHVKAELLHDDMRLKNIGADKVKKRQKNKVMGYNAYAGERSIKKRKEQQKYREKYLKSKITKSGKSAFEMQKTNEAKLTELYLELRALEEIAEEKGYTWLFITPTCPPEYHSNPSEGKLCWKGASARDSHDFLQGQWRNLNKSFTKKIGKDLKFGIDGGNGFGKRVVEPHKSGCAHWHIMLFCNPEFKEQYKELFRHYFGKDKRRCAIIEKGRNENGEKLDKEEASAASYMLKYMTKTSSAELEGGKIKGTELVAIDAWKHATGIRSHAPFGYKGVKTKYTDCRKIANKSRRSFEIVSREGKILKEAQKINSLMEEVGGNAVKNFMARILIEAKVPELKKQIQKPKSLENAKRALILRIMKSEAEKAKRKATSGAEYLQRLDDEYSKAKELLAIIGTSSVKTKRLKSGAKGTDYREFMRQAEKLTYNTVEDINRFGEKVLKRTTLGTEYSTITLTKEEWKSNIKGIQVNEDDLLNKAL